MKSTMHISQGKFWNSPNLPAFVILQSPPTKIFLERWKKISRWNLSPLSANNGCECYYSLACLYILHIRLHLMYRRNIYKNIYPGSPLVSWLPATGGEISFASILVYISYYKTIKQQNPSKVTRVLRLLFFAGFYALS